MKKLYKLFGLIMITISLASCNDIFQSSSEAPQEEPVKPPITVENISEPTPLETKLDYLVNEQIQQGNIEDILEEIGVVGETDYLDYTGTAYFLGFDKNRNLIMIEDGTTYDLVSIPKKGNKKILVENIMDDRNRQIKFAIYQEPYLVWSECPNARTLPDPTMGSDWAVYLLNVKTGKKTLIDYDQGLRVNAKYLHRYLCPMLLDIDGDYIVYPGFAKNTQNTIVPVIKTYQISSKEIKIIEELKSDLFHNALGAPSIYGNLITWPEAYINEDATYDGFCVLYDLNTGEKKKILTPENVINPTLTDGYLIATNQPNVTFYDAEIVVLDLTDMTWKLKINSNFSIYSNNKYNPLYVSGCNMDYCTWDAPMIDSLAFLDYRQQLVYHLIKMEEGHQVNHPIIHNGNVLTWFEHVETENGLTPRLYYYYLK